MKKIVNTILATGIVAAAIARVTTFPAQAQNECRLTFSGYEGKETLKDGCKIDRKMLELLRAK